MAHQNLLDKPVELPKSPRETLKKLLPFPHFSREWYVKQQTEYNAARDSLRKSAPVERDSLNVMISMDRSQMQGSLESNMEMLQEQITSLSSSAKVRHLMAVSEVARFILLSGPLVKTQEAGMVYLRCKGLNTKKRSCEYCEIFVRHLIIIQVYIFNTGYLLPRTGGPMHKFIQTIKDTVNKEQVVQEHIAECLHDTFKQALQYMDTHRDRQAAKALFAPKGWGIPQ